MDLAFYKLHSTGSDYILVSFLQEPERDLDLIPGLARRICHRRTGVGANGLIVLTKGIEHPLSILYYDTSGAAIRLPCDALMCVGRYAFNLGLVNRSLISAESGHGAVSIDVIDSVSFRVPMGVPAFPGTDESVFMSSSANPGTSGLADGRRVPYTPLVFSDFPSTVMAVIPTDRRPRSIKALAQSVSKSRDFSPYQSVFLQSISNEVCSGYCWADRHPPDHAAAMAGCAAVGILHGFCDNEVAIRFRSYMLHAQWAADEQCFYVTAPTDYICSGSYSAEDVELERERDAGGINGSDF